MKSRCHELNLETQNYYGVNLAFFNNWHYSTNWRNRRKKQWRIGGRRSWGCIVYLIQLQPFRTCFGERASLENTDFLTLLRCIGSIKEPSRSYPSSCQFCVGGPVVNRGGNTPTCRHESLQHWTRTISWNHRNSATPLGRVTKMTDS